MDLVSEVDLWMIRKEHVERTVPGVIDLGLLCFTGQFSLELSTIQGCTFIVESAKLLIVLSKGDIAVIELLNQRIFLAVDFGSLSLDIRRKLGIE